MKTNNYTRKLLTLMTTCVLLLSTHGTSQASSSDTKSGRHALSNDGRLIVMRIPNLGNHVIVDLSVDGVAVRPIEYGQTYKGLLSPGRHVLSVVASPNAKWKTPSDIILNVRKGETYSFTAMGDGSGNLILKGV
jgi:hypothetical protein